MPTRNVVLTDHQAMIVEQLVASGRYQNASEVLREGLRMIERREAEESARLTALREAAHIGSADIEAGRFRVFAAPEVLDRHLSTLANVIDVLRLLHDSMDLPRHLPAANESGIPA